MDALSIDLEHPLRGFDLGVAVDVDGALALVGPSGAGKTTVLRAVAGLLTPRRGRIALGAEAWFDSARRIDLPPERRSVGFVFQSYALFPHLTVAANVAYAARANVHELLERFGIAHLARARPRELSAGERQRVALARALAREPDVVLLDEPLGALDAHTRAAVRVELQQLLDRLSIPVLVVTHDFEDAAALATKIGIVHDGRLEQLATPVELVARPRSPFVASLTGSNLLRGLARAGGGGLTEVTLDDGQTVWSTDDASGRVGVVVQPWEIAIAREVPADSALNHVRGRVSSIVPVGNRMRVRVGGLAAEVTAASAERLGLGHGDEVVAAFKATATRLLALR